MQVSQLTAAVDRRLAAFEAKPPLPWLRRLPLWVPVALSLLLTSLLPLTSRNRYADLSDHFTDHLHHSFAVWKVFESGVDVYRKPFSAIWEPTAFRHPDHGWGHMPALVYPPGVVAVFLPTALLGRFAPLTPHAFAVACLLWMLLLAHAALLAAFAALRALPGRGKLLVGALVWLVFMRLGLQGFYEPVFIGCGAMMLRALALGRERHALRWFAVAALVNLHAVVLVPVALVALWRLVADKPPRAWPWFDVVLLAVVGALCLWSFSQFYPTTAAHRARIQADVLRLDRRFWLLVATTAAAAVVCWRWADNLTRAVLLATAGLAAIDPQHYWHHTGMMVLTPLAVGAVRAGRAPGLARAALVAWMFVAQPTYWEKTPFELFADLAGRLR